MAEQSPNKPAGGLVLVGKFGGAQGVRGEIRIRSFTADPMALAQYDPLFDAAGKRTFRLSAVREWKDGMLIARVEGVRDRAEAEALTNLDLYVHRADLPEPDEEEFYYSDLIGLEARLENGKAFGRIRLVDNFGAGDILFIDRPDGSEAMIAFTLVNVPLINLDKGFVVVNPPDETEVDLDSGA